MRRITAAALVLALALLTGCAETVERERRALVDATWRETVTLADQTVTLLLDLHPDLTLIEVDGDFTGERWGDCSSSVLGNAVSPTEISWTSRRDIEVEPAQDSAALADSVAEWFVAQGWTTLEVWPRDGVHENNLRRDGYKISISSTTDAPTDQPQQIRIRVSSPCVRAPERMLDWTTPAPTPAGSPS